MSGHSRIATSSKKCGILAANNDIMGVRGQVPGNCVCQIFSIGWHCVEMRVTLQRQREALLVDVGKILTLTMIQHTEQTNSIRIGCRMMESENVRQ